MDRECLVGMARAGDISLHRAVTAAGGIARDRSASGGVFPDTEPNVDTRVVATGVDRLRAEHDHRNTVLLWRSRDLCQQRGVPTEDGADWRGRAQRPAL